MRASHFAALSRALESTGLLFAASSNPDYSKCNAKGLGEVGGNRELGGIICERPPSRLLEDLGLTTAHKGTVLQEKQHLFGLQSPVSALSNLQSEAVCPIPAQLPQGALRY